MSKTVQCDFDGIVVELPLHPMTKKPRSGRALILRTDWSKKKQFFIYDVRTHYDFWDKKDPQELGWIPFPKLVKEKK